MKAFSYRTVKTQLFNRGVTFEVGGVEDSDGVVVEVNSLFIVNGDGGLTFVESLAQDVEVEKSIIKLMNEPKEVIKRVNMLEALAGGTKQ